MTTDPFDFNELSKQPSHQSAPHVTAAQAGFAAVLGDALAALWAREALTKPVVNDTRLKNLRRNSPRG